MSVADVYNWCRYKYRALEPLKPTCLQYQTLLTYYIPCTYTYVDQLDWLSVYIVGWTESRSVYYYDSVDLPDVWDSVQKPDNSQYQSLPSR